MDARPCPFCFSEPKFDEKWSPSTTNVCKLQFGCFNPLCAYQPKSEWAVIDGMLNKLIKIKLNIKKTEMITIWNERPRI